MKPASEKHAAAPLLLLAASFGGGVVLIRLLSPSFFLCFTTSLVFSLGALFFFLRRAARPATICLLGAFLGQGGAQELIVSAGVARERVRSLCEREELSADEPVEVEGVLERAPESAPDGLYLTLGVREITAKGRTSVASGSVSLFMPSAGAEELELHRGARLRVMTRLSRRENYRNPGGGSLAEYLDRRGLDAVGMIKSPLLIERLHNEPVLLPLFWLERWRALLLAEMDRLFASETAGVLKAALLGNRHFLSRQTAERYREGGTFHVLVISGLHISFIGGLALWLSRLVARHPLWQFTSAALFLWGYTLMVGAETSVVRAALTFTVVALAPVLFRRAQPLNALGAAALSLLAWRPAEISDPSFQLTFLSVLAIITIAWPLLTTAEALGAWRPTRSTPYPPCAPRQLILFCQLLYWSEANWRAEMARCSHSYRLDKHPWAVHLERFGGQKIVRYLVAAFVVSASVQLALTPLLILYFHRLSPVSLLLNMWVGALMAILSLAAGAALGVAQFSDQLAAPLVWLAEQANWLMSRGSDPLLAVRGSSWRLPEYTGWAGVIYGLYYAPLAALTVKLLGWRPLNSPVPRHGRASRVLIGSSLLSVVTLLGLMILHPWSETYERGKLEVSFLDVGQGDAAFAVMPDGTTLLIDGGGRPSHASQEENAGEFEPDRRTIGEMVVSEYLWWRGFDRVDYLVATHADADHIQGLGDVARHFRMRGALIGREAEGHLEYERFLAALQRRNVPLRLVGRGDTFSFGGATVEILWPRVDFRAARENNDSVVIRLRYGRRCFLLTGDIEKETEAQMLTWGEVSGCDVVKVGHHGSRTSSTLPFVEATRPSVAVISVGLSSPFGHPAPEVVERWRSRGSWVLTTGQHGTITIRTDGEELQVSTFVKE